MSGLKIGRRGVLAGLAAITAAPGTIGKAEAASISITAPATPSPLLAEQASAISSPAPGGALAAKIAEIAKRNQFRAEAGLPLLSVAKEIRRAKEREAGLKEAEQFERFAGPLRERVSAKVLARRRRLGGDAKWTPDGWFGRLGFRSEVENRLRKLYNRVCNNTKRGRNTTGTFMPIERYTTPVHSPD